MRVFSGIHIELEFQWQKNKTSCSLQLNSMHIVLSESSMFGIFHVRTLPCIDVRLFYEFIFNSSIFSLPSGQNLIRFSSLLELWNWTKFIDRIYDEQQEKIHYEKKPIPIQLKCKFRTEINVWSYSFLFIKIVDFYFRKYRN